MLVHGLFLIGFYHYTFKIMTCISGCNYSLCTPDDGCGWHPKLLEWLGSKTNKDCLELHLTVLLNAWYIGTKSLASYFRTPPWWHICFTKFCKWESEKTWHILIVISFLIYNSAVVFVGYNIWPRTPVGLWELKQTAVSLLFSCGEVTGCDVISSISGYKWRWEIWTDSCDL